MDNVLKLVEHWIFNQSGGEDVIDAIKKLDKKIALSKLLSVSHVFCDKCNLYTDCNQSEWIMANPELYDSEVLCFADLIDECKDYIEFDINDASSKKLRKLYRTIISV